MQFDRLYCIFILSFDSLAQIPALPLHQIIMRFPLFTSSSFKGSLAIQKRMNYLKIYKRGGGYLLIKQLYCKLSLMLGLRKRRRFASGGWFRWLSRTFLKILFHYSRASQGQREVISFDKKSCII